MREITKEIIQFSNFLNASWPFIELYIKKDVKVSETLSDWLQANWEILVETSVCANGEFILVYGNGADFDDSESSRVTYKSAIATHFVKVKKKGTELIDFFSKEKIENLNEFHFNQFVSIDASNKIANEPQFDYAELENIELDTKVWVEKKDLFYFLVNIN